jgi:hypothetical protein
LSDYACLLNEEEKFPQLKGYNSGNLTIGAEYFAAKCKPQHINTMSGVS